MTSDQTPATDHIHPARRLYPASIDYAIGKWLRRHGRYGDATLAHLRTAWQKRPSPKHLLGLLSLQRDLGVLPAPAQLLELARQLNSLPAGATRSVANLLCECGMQAALLQMLPADRLSLMALHSPPVAELLSAQGIHHTS